MILTVCPVVSIVSPALPAAVQSSNCEASLQSYVARTNVPPVYSTIAAFNPNGFQPSDGVGVGEYEIDGVILGVEDGVNVGVTLGVTDGVILGVSDGVILIDGVNDGVTLGVSDGVILGVSDGVILGVNDGVGVSDDVGVGVGCAG